MNGPLRIYLLAICLPALLLTGGGIWLLHLDFTRAQRDAATEYNVRADAAAAKLGKALRAVQATDDALLSELRRFADEMGSIGVLWHRERGYVASTHGESLDWFFCRQMKWQAVGKSERTRPRRGWMVVDLGSGISYPQNFLWTWVDDNYVAAVHIASGSPNALPPEDGLRYPIALCLILLMLSALFSAGFCLVWMVRRARREAREQISFVDNVSHELNTPLASIVPYSKMLRDDMFEDEADRREAVEVLIEESERLHRMVSRLLDFSRLENGRRRYDIKPLEVRPLCEEAVALLRSRFATHGITVSGGETAAAVGDRDAVKEIILNLLDNAAKYAASQGPVEVVIAEGDADVRITVADRGPGLDDEGLKRAFDRFWQEDRSLTRENGGLGIGLSICRRYTADMGGSLVARSRDGGGLEMILSLKLFSDPCP